MKRPSFLQKGDTIAIIAPSGATRIERIEQGLSYLHTWGVNIIEGKYTRKKYGSLAATDHERLADLQWAFDHPDIKAIICVRGGYGLTRIIDQLEMKPFLENPKWLIGFSDITALHHKINCYNIPSLHACMLAQMGENNTDISKEKLRAFLFGEHLDTFNVPPSQYNRTGMAEGIVIGGNLALINDQIGTPTALDTYGKILFIEEIGEYRYTIDRMMTHLKRCGLLDHLKALIVGQITDTKNNDQNEFPLRPEEIIYEKVKDFKYPVAFNFPIGHEQPNYPLVLGEVAQLNVDLNLHASLSLKS